MEKIKKISIILAAYKEKGNVEELAIRISKTMRKIKTQFEIIYIIAGEDGSYESLLNLKKKIKEIKVYKEKEKGFGPAFKYGFSKIADNSTHVITMDADLNHMPEEIPIFINSYKKTGANIVLGSRLIQGATMIKRTPLKDFVSNLVNAICPRLYGLRIKDITSGYRFFEKKVVQNICPKIVSKNFELLPEFLIRAEKAGYKIVESPIHFQPRTRGKSKMNFFKVGFGYINLTFKSIAIRLGK